MSYFLIFLAVVLAAAAALYVVGLNKPAPDAPIYDDAMAAPLANRPPVLLPLRPAPADVDRLRFALGLRGYRMDQVDEVLDRLRDELIAKDARIAELEGAAAVFAAKDATEPTAAGDAPAATAAPAAPAGEHREQ